MGCPVAGAAPGAPRGTWGHGVGAPRGSDIAVAVGRDQEGRYGLLVRKAPAFNPPDDVLGELAGTMTDPRGPGQDPSDGDQWDNPDITAGYTFFGQFVDHDLTRDTTPLSGQKADPHGLRNFDTPVLDLGSVYGRGPEADPQLYDPARPGYLRVDDHDGLWDLPRTPDGSAVIGDPRNDENLVVAQLHVAFLRFHNALRDEGLSFLQAQRATVWHYQWLVVHEFLPRVCGQQVVDGLLAQGGRVPWYKPRNLKRPMMPIEFSAAAYRFGHSMVRPEYEMNDADTGPIFAHPGDPRDDLRGSRPVPANYRADWTYFFDVPGRERPSGLNFARLIDADLALPLHDLPPTVVPRDRPPVFTDLAHRNLLRGKQLGLSSGQDVAVALGQRPLDNTALGLTDPRWGGRAPLWFYVLKEAELTQGGRRLGPTGALLVAGTILTLLAVDPASFLRARPAWMPARVPFTVGDFLLRAGAV
jgi:Animal haem peroxidase